MSEWFFYTAMFGIAACAAYLAYLVYTAPEGYEGEDGFHYGKDPKDNG